MINKKFPQVVYVHIEEPESENEFFMCNDNIEAAAVLDEKRVVAVYKLQEIVQVETEIITKRL